MPLTPSSILYIYPSYFHLLQWRKQLNSGSTYELVKYMHNKCFGAQLNILPKMYFTLVVSAYSLTHSLLWSVDTYLFIRDFTAPWSNYFNAFSPPSTSSIILTHTEKNRQNYMKRAQKAFYAEYVHKGWSLTSVNLTETIGWSNSFNTDICMTGYLHWTNLTLTTVD